MSSFLISANCQAFYIHCHGQCLNTFKGTHFNFHTNESLEKWVFQNFLVNKLKAKKRSISAEEFYSIMFSAFQITSDTGKFLTKGCPRQQNSENVISAWVGNLLSL